ncbi:MAG TPA: response regulator [Candidatus Omnitrophota bacterium]|nr:response regulator [Candidatus Omnitrophota bacterium]
MSEQYKVLMIEDETDIIYSLAQVFENFKHIKFIGSESALQGIELAKAERPGVILLDLHMPRMSGEEALEELKKLLPETKFIVMTGWEDGETKQRIERMGIDAYFSKPMDLEKLVTKIISLLMIKNEVKNG